MVAIIFNWIQFNIEMHSVIDKIIIYGVPNPDKLNLTDVLNNKIKVQTLQFYSSPTSPTPQFMQKIDFEMWAYPDGIKIYNEHFQIINDNQPEFSFFENTDLINVNNNNNTNILNTKQLQQSIYSFVLTDYDLNRTYCTSIVWNEVYFINDDRADMKDESQFNNSKALQKIFKTPKQHYSLAVPKCTVTTMINNPLILDPNTVLVYVPKVMIVISKTPCIQLQRSLLKYYYESVIMENVNREKKTLNVPKIFEDDFNNLIKNYGYPKAQSLFNSNKSQTLRKIQLQLLKSIIGSDLQKDRPLGLMSLQTNKLRQFYLSSLFTIPQNHKHTYLITENGRRIGSKLKTDTVFHLPKDYDLCSSQFECHNKTLPALLPLPIPEFIQLWKCLLLEKQIIIFSSSQYKSIMLSQFMLYLIQPIIWENIYIPFLPFHLAHHIDAIGGYLIGMSRIHMDYMLDKFDMKTKVVVDLDYQTVLQQGGKQVIELPQQIQSYIESSLKSILQSYQQSKKSNRGLINYLSINSTQLSTLQEKIKLKQNFINCILLIQKVFFHTLVALFNNFVPFISKKEDGIIQLKTENYLNIIQNKLHKIFMREISKTMVFMRLCQYHVGESEKCAWVQKTIGELFVYSHDILSHKFIVSEQDMNNIDINTVSIGSSNKVSVNEKQVKSVTPFSLSYILKGTKNVNQGTYEKQILTPTKQKQKQKRAYGWKISDLLNKQQKYYQYIEYLFDKNLKQIVNTTKIIEEYLGAQQNKYNVLMSNNQFDTFQSLQSIKLPNNFGNLSKDQSINSIQKQQKIIYQQLYKQQAIKSKKWKKFGQKDQQDLYEQFPKVCTQTKVQRLLIKYLKLIQLNHPQAMLKGKKGRNKKTKKNKGLFDWFWDLVHPSDEGRVKQQSQIKSSIQKKLANKLSKIEIVNLDCLFQQKNELDNQQIGGRKNKGKQEGKNNKKSIMNNKQYQKLIENLKENRNSLRTSRMHSEVVKYERKNSQKEEKQSDEVI